VTVIRSVFCVGFLAGLLLSPLAYALDADTDQRLAEAEQLYRQDGAEAALPVFERLLDEFAESEDAKNTALATGYIGECHWRLGNFEFAREYLDRALLLKRELGDRLQQGKTLNVLGLLDWDEGNFDEAIARFGEASAIGQELGDRKLEGAILNNLSMVYDELGDYRTSLKQYQQVLDIYSEIDFPRGEGDTLGNIGGVHLLLGHYNEAVNFYRKALQISEQLESVPAMSQDHGNLGLSYTGLGKIDTALQHFDQALELAGKAGMRQEQGLWLRGKANAQIKAGRYDLGLNNHRAALEIYAEVEARPLLLEALHDLGQLFLALGDPSSAEQYFQRAMEFAREIEFPRGITINLLALGDLQYRHQRIEPAADLYTRALQRSVVSGEQGFRCEALLRLAQVHLDQQRFEQAINETEEALNIAREIEAWPLEALALYMQAELEREQGRLELALDDYATAFELSSKLGDPDLLWQIEYGRALALVEDGQKQAAVSALRAAVGHIESVRNRLREKRFRAGYLQDKHQVYIELVRLQLDMGESNAAFSTAERLRAWSYTDQSGHRAAVAYTETQRLMETEMRGRIRKLQRMLDDENTRTPPERRQLAVDTFSQELMVAEREYQSFLDDVQGRQSSGAFPGFKIDQEILRRGLRSSEALVEYIVGAENVMIFVLNAKGLRATSIPLRRADLHARLELLRDLIQQRDGDRWKKPASSLSRSLLEPLLINGWLDGIEQLYVVPHEILNYLPFALLPLGTAPAWHPVIDKYTLTYLPSASALANNASARDKADSILAVAPGRSRLRHAPEEASSIAEMFQPYARLLTGVQATESAFKNIAGNYQTLHLATHGYFNKLNPLLSGLELEPDLDNDGLLEVHEILDLKLHSNLVTLSACETGLGGGFFAEIPAGDDFVGLTRAFLQAGSSSVLATLWEVDDRSTVDLMKNFYRRLEEPGAKHDKAVALANAQRALRSSGKYKHPYYWAPFVLVGSVNLNQQARS
jgi:CHAT domain-containing protein/Tfp pilus assembly protein PilF